MEWIINMWREILKNIQISGQKTVSRNYARDDEEDDCFQYFYDLVKLMHPDFELKRQIYPDQPEDYWCRVKDTGWNHRNSGVDFELYEMGEDVMDSNWAEIQIFFTLNENFDVSPPKKIISVTFKMPETYETDTLKVLFTISNQDMYKYSLPDSDKTSSRYVDNVEEIWKKMQQYMRSL